MVAIFRKNSIVHKICHQILVLPGLTQNLLDLLALMIRVPQIGLEDTSVSASLSDCERPQKVGLLENCYKTGNRAQQRYNNLSYSRKCHAGKSPAQLKPNVIVFNCLHRYITTQFSKAPLMSPSLTTSMYKNVFVVCM